MRKAPPGGEALCLRNFQRTSSGTGGQAVQVRSDADAGLVVALERAFTDENELLGVTRARDFLVLLDLAKPEEGKHAGVDEEGIPSDTSRGRHDAVGLDEHLAERTFIDVRIGDDADSLRL